MNVKRLAPRTAWYLRRATFTAAPVFARSGIRQGEGERVSGRPTAPKPSPVRRYDQAAAGSSKTRDAALLAIAGCTALALGSIVYLTDRNVSHAALIPAIAALAGSNLFGPFGQWLPAAVHPFAFSLFTAAALPSRSAWRYGACAAWGGVNVAFELGQHPLVSGYLASALQASDDHSVQGQMLANYFLRGTFDGADVLAAVLGAFAAASFLRLMQHAREKDHAS